MGFSLHPRFMERACSDARLVLFLKEREVDYVKVIAMSAEETAQTLVSRLPKTERTILLVAADMYFPAAIKQLDILGESVGVGAFSMGTDVDPVEIARSALEKAALEGHDTVLVDTAGREVIDLDLVEKISAEVSHADAAKMTKMMLDADFDLGDFLKPTKLLLKTGSLAGVAKMLPGSWIRARSGS